MAFNDGLQLATGPAPKTLTKESKSVNIKELGGVRYDANLFEGSIFNHPGRKYCLKAKSGETILFNEQKPGAEIKLNLNKGNIFDKSEFKISEMDNFDFKSSIFSQSNVELSFCHNSFIDLSDGKFGFYGDHATIIGGSGNTVKLDSRDEANIYHYHIKGEGIASQDSYSFTG